MHDLRKRFGHLVAAHRKRRGLTQEGLAIAVDLSKDMITRIEIGGTGTSFAAIQKIADALDVDPAELFTGELQGGAKQRQALADLTAKLAGLSDRDLAWLSGVIDAALKAR